MLFENLFSNFHAVEQVLLCQTDIADGVRTHLALDGEEAAIADLLKSREILREVNTTRAERYFFRL